MVSGGKRGKRNERPGTWQKNVLKIQLVHLGLATTHPYLLIPRPLHIYIGLYIHQDAFCPGHFARKETLRIRSMPK